MNWTDTTKTTFTRRSIETVTNGCTVSVEEDLGGAHPRCFAYAKTTSYVQFGIMIAGTLEEVASVAIDELTATLELALAELRGVTEAQS